MFKYFHNDYVNVYSLRNKISRLDAKECLSKYGTDIDKSFINKIEFKGEDNYTQHKQVSYSVWDINSAITCRNLPVNISLDSSYNNIPLHNVSEIKFFLNKGIDLFNENNPFFNDRCSEGYYPYNKQYTLKERRQNYLMNQTISCTPGCDYGGLDDNGNIMCSCNNTYNSINISILPAHRNSVTTLNWDVIGCMEPITKRVRI
jgi:hypothetical protein